MNHIIRADITLARSIFGLERKARPVRFHCGSQVQLLGTDPHPIDQQHLQLHIRYLVGDEGFIELQPSVHLEAPLFLLP